MKNSTFPDPIKKREKYLQRSLILLFLILSISIFSTFNPTIYNLIHSFKYNRPSQQIVLGLDFKGGARIVYKAKENKWDKNQDVEKLLEESKKILIKRLSQMGNFEPDIKVDNRRQEIILELPGVSEYDSISNIVGQTGRLDIFVHSGKGDFMDYYFRTVPDSILGDLVMTKADIKNVRVETAPDIHVAFEIEEKSQKKVTDNLSNHSGKYTLILISGKLVHVVMISDDLSKNIMINGVLYPNPIEKNDIVSLLQISNENGMTLAEAQNTEQILNWDVLPLDLSITEINRIDSLIGSKQFYISISALILGIILLFFYFLVFYGRYLGAIGSLSIIITVLIITGIFSASGLVLNLPGLAGLILTLGVTCDSIILIFESIKEDIRERKSLGLTAFDEQSMLTSISKITTYLWNLRITTALGVFPLFLFPGPMKGFAITMIIGILVSILTTSKRFLGSLLMKFENQGRIISRLAYGIPFFEDKRIANGIRRILEYKGRFAFITIFSACISLVLIFTMKFNVSSDFFDGTQLQFHFTEKISKNELQKLADKYAEKNNIKIFRVHLNIISDN